MFPLSLTEASQFKACGDRQACSRPRAELLPIEFPCVTMGRWCIYWIN